MSKKQIFALVLIGLCAIIFILNRGSVSVHLLVTQINAMKSLVFLAFTAIGVAIGVLLK